MPHQVTKGQILEAKHDEPNNLNLYNTPQRTYDNSFKLKANPS